MSWLHKSLLKYAQQEGLTLQNLSALLGRKDVDDPNQGYLIEGPEIEELRRLRSMHPETIGRIKSIMELMDTMFEAVADTIKHEPDYDRIIDDYELDNEIDQYVEMYVGDFNFTHQREEDMWSFLSKLEESEANASTEDFTIYESDVAFRSSFSWEKREGRIPTGYRRQRVQTAPGAWEGDVWIPPTSAPGNRIRTPRDILGLPNQHMFNRLMFDMRKWDDMMDEARPVDTSMQDVINAYGVATRALAIDPNGSTQEEEAFLDVLAAYTGEMMKPIIDEENSNHYGRRKEFERDGNFPPWIDEDTLLNNLANDFETELFEWYKEQNMNGQGGLKENAEEAISQSDSDYFHEKERELEHETGIKELPKALQDYEPFEPESADEDWRYALTLGTILDIGRSLGDDKSIMPGAEESGSYIQLYVQGIQNIIQQDEVLKFIFNNDFMGLETEPEKVIEGLKEAIETGYEPPHFIDTELEELRNLSVQQRAEAMEQARIEREQAAAAEELARQQREEQLRIADEIREFEELESILRDPNPETQLEKLTRWQQRQPEDRLLQWQADPNDVRSQLMSELEGMQGDIAEHTRGVEERARLREEERARREIQAAEAAQAARELMVERQKEIDKLHYMLEEKYYNMTPENLQRMKDLGISNKPFGHSYLLERRNFPGGTGSRPGPGAESFRVSIAPDKEYLAKIPRELLEEMGIHSTGDPGGLPALGWVGGFADYVNKILYVAEVQSDIMQRTVHMRDPEKSKKQHEVEQARIGKEITKLQASLQNVTSPKQRLIGKIDNIRLENEITPRQQMQQRIDEVRQQLQSVSPYIADMPPEPNNQYTKLKASLEGLLREVSMAPDVVDTNSPKYIKNQQLIDRLLGQLSQVSDTFDTSKTEQRIIALQEQLAKFEERDFSKGTGEGAARYVKNYPQWHDYKSRVENTFKDWIPIFFNVAMREAQNRGFTKVRIASSEYLQSRWASYSRPETKVLFDRVYDGTAQQYGAKPVDVGGNKWYEIDIPAEGGRIAMKKNWLQKVANFDPVQWEIHIQKFFEVSLQRMPELQESEYDLGNEFNAQEGPRAVFIEWLKEVPPELQQNGQLHPNFKEKVRQWLIQNYQFDPFENEVEEMETPEPDEMENWWG